MAQGNHWSENVWAKLKRAALLIAGLFAGRISRTTFALCAGLYAAIFWLLFLPVTTFLWTSPKTLVDAHMVFFFGMFFALLIGFVRQYVRRLHDVGFHGLWAIIPLVAIPAGVLYLGSEYSARRSAADFTDNTSDVVSITGWLAIGLPLLIGLWRGNPETNRFGQPPQLVEHVWASRFNRAVIVTTAAAVVMVSIFAGFVQDGIWVGRSEYGFGMPIIDSNPAGRQFMKCWGIRGIGAGTGKGPLKGFYRDGYDDVVFDFSVLPDGNLDVTTAGKTVAKSYRRDGFKIISYGLQGASDDPQFLNVREADHFMVLAMYDDGSAGSLVNYTTFAFSRGDSGLDYEMIMSTTLSGPRDTSPTKFPAARAKLMIGDCMPM